MNTPKRFLQRRRSAFFSSDKCFTMAYLRERMQNMNERVILGAFYLFP